jgi:peptidoglycan/LPS O-acetylase OafA/YrhL
LCDRAHFFFFYRIPAFIFGMACAYWIRHGVSQKYYIVILFAGIPLFAILYPQHHQVYNYKNFSFLFLLPATTICFILISKYIRFLNPLMDMMGKASLEIYLIQSMFYHAINVIRHIFSPLWHDITTTVLIIISTLLGVTVHWLINKSGILKVF